MASAVALRQCCRRFWAISSQLQGVSRSDGQFRTRTVSVSQQQAPVVRDLIESGAVVARILEFLNSSK
jgi:hypothetical protein